MLFHITVIQNFDHIVMKLQKFYMKFVSLSSQMSHYHFIFMPLQALLFIKLTTDDLIPIITRYECEKTFIDVTTDKSQGFPFLEEKPTVVLSVIVPAYNEQDRCKCLFFKFI